MMLIVNARSLVCIALFSCFSAGFSLAQETFSRQDTLRGSITPQREWWDLSYYHLDIAVDPADSTIKGSNTIGYKVLEPGRSMQIDLQAPMQIDKIWQQGEELSFTQEGNAWFVQLEEAQIKGDYKEIKVAYSGKPRVSPNAPWEGGLSWEHDDNGYPFVATSCQGAGASLWWPCKDHLYDEPDSMLISVTVPKPLVEVSNGRLLNTVDNEDGTRTYHWFVSNPINNYGVNVNIGDYVHFSETYEGEKGPLDCNYYVLRDNLEEAKKQFADARRTLEAFEYWFGPYPFYEDGYKLVEVPYLGMEHQSSVTYGNGYQNGYLGQDLSQTGWGMKFDFIIVHESGHEWFGNNISNRDIADMWIHESFTAYSESLFLDYYYGKEAAEEYVIGTRTQIDNDRPIIGIYGVNHEGSGDMYFKGSNMLHTLRKIVDDDKKWRQMLRGLNKEFYHQTVTTEQVEQFIGEELNMELDPFFDQYLRDTRIPVLEYRFVDGNLLYRWSNCVPGFDMPVRVNLNGKEKLLKPSAMWQFARAKKEDNQLIVDRGFYVIPFDNTVEGAGE